MIHLESRNIPTLVFQKKYEETLYKEMLNNMICTVPMHELKRIFPLVIKETEDGYLMQIRIEILETNTK